MAKKIKTREERAAEQADREVLRPWGVLIVQGGLVLSGPMEADAPQVPSSDGKHFWSRPEFLTCEELSHRLRLPIVAAISTCGDGRYLSGGCGERGGVPVKFDDQVRLALDNAREMFPAALPATVTRESELRVWCAEQLRAIRQELEAAEASLAAGTPWQGTYEESASGGTLPGERATFDYGARIAQLAAKYADTLLDLHCSDERTLIEDENEKT